MLLKHSIQYLLARGLPGIVNFLAIALYTRILSTDEYGRYALVIAGVGFFHVIFFQWLELALLRFLPANLNNPKPLLSNLGMAFAILALVVGSVGFLLSMLWPDHAWRFFILLAVSLLLAKAWFQLNLELARSSLEPLSYGLMNAIKAVLALLIGVGLVLWGLGAYGPLLGLLLGMILAACLLRRVEWKGLYHRISQPLISEMLHYGLPLSATFALGFVVSSSDRFLIAWLLGDGPTGVYSAAYDLGKEALTLLMVTINLAAFPLAVRALERKGVVAAQKQLRHNFTLLLAIAFPATVGMAVLAPNVCAVILGESFSGEAADLLPWIAFSVLLWGLRAYHFGLAFQLGRRTIWQVFVAVSAAILNIVLNLWWIPIFGLMGAAYATFATYVMDFSLCAALGQRVFPMPIPYQDSFKIAIASMLMGLTLWLSLEYQGFYVLIAQVLVGGTLYSVLIGLLNVGGYRSRLLRKLIT